ncbi:MAG: ribosome assembly cofactor RimP [Bacteroidales bacterium]|jgi:ribosome maturation factor RimP|nr:ribosome assembly cofactor RimP [Bacteroidales bacterium]
MIQKEKIEEILAEFLAQRSDLFLVDVKVSRENDIEIVIEIDKGSLSLDDCVNISRFVESKLDRDEEDFSLTVGSAGLSTPFKVLRQYRKALGSEIELKLKNGGHFKGVLAAASEEGITFVTKVSEKVEGQKKKVIMEVVEEYTFDQIKSAKPVIKFDKYKNR